MSSKKRSSNERIEDEINRIIDDFDVDGNGIIDKKEFRALIDRFLYNQDSHYSDDDVNRLYNEIDVDNSHSLDRGEIVKFLIQKVGPRRKFSEEIIGRANTDVFGMNLVGEIGGIFRQKILMNGIETEADMKKVQDSVEKEIKVDHDRYDEICTWREDSVAEEKDFWRRSMKLNEYNAEKKKSIKKAFDAYYYIAYERASSMDSTEVKIVKEIKSWVDLFAINEEFPGVKDRKILYKYLLYHVYGDKSVCDFLENEILHGYIPAICNDDSTYDPETKKNMLKVIIYYWMTPYVEGNVNNSVEQPFLNKFFREERVDNQFLSKILRNVSQEPNDQNGGLENQYLYFKLAVVIREVEERGDTLSPDMPGGCTSIFKKLINYLRNNSNFFFSSLRFDESLYSTNQSKDRLKLLRLQTYLLSKLTDFIYNKNGGTEDEKKWLLGKIFDGSEIFSLHQPGDSLLWSCLIKLEQGNLNDSESMEVAACTVNILKSLQHISHMLHQDVVILYLSQLVNSMHDKWFYIQRIFKNTKRQIWYLIVQNVITCISKTYKRDPERFELRYQNDRDFARNLDELVRRVLCIVPTRLATGASKCVREVYDLVNCAYIKSPIFIDLCVNHLKCDANLRIETEKYLISNKKHLIEYIPRLVDSFLAFSQFNIEMHVALGGDISDRYSFGIPKTVLKLLKASFSLTDDHSADAKKAIYYLINPFKNLCLLLERELELCQHLDDLKKEFSSSTLNMKENIKEQNLYELLSEFYYIFLSPLKIESMKKAFEELERQVDEFRRKRIIPPTRPELEEGKKKHVYYPKSHPGNTTFVGSIMEPVGKPREMEGTKAVQYIENLQMEVDPEQPNKYWPKISRIRDLEGIYSNPLEDFIDPWETTGKYETYRAQFTIEDPDGQGVKENIDYGYLQEGFKGTGQKFAPCQVISTDGYLIFTGPDGTPSEGRSPEYKGVTQEVAPYVRIPLQGSKVSFSFWKRVSSSYLDDYQDKATFQGEVGTGRNKTPTEIFIYDENDQNLSKIFRSTIVNIDFNRAELHEIKRKVRQVYQIESETFILFSKVDNGEWTIINSQDDLRQLGGVIHYTGDGFTSTSSSEKDQMIVENVSLKVRLCSNMELLNGQSWQGIERELRADLKLNSNSLETLKQIYDWAVQNLKNDYQDLKVVLEKKYSFKWDQWEQLKSLTRNKEQREKFESMSRLLYFIACQIRPDSGEESTLDRKLKFLTKFYHDKSDRNVFDKNTVELLLRVLKYNSAQDLTEDTIQQLRLPDKISKKDFENILTNSSSDNKYQLKENFFEKTWQSVKPQSKSNETRSATPSTQANPQSATSKIPDQLFKKLQNLQKSKNLPKWDQNSRPKCQYNGCPTSEKHPHYTALCRRFFQDKGDKAYDYTKKIIDSGKTKKEKQRELEKIPKHI